MFAVIVILLIFIIPILCIVFKPFVVVNEGEAVAVERLGRLHRIVGPGIQFLIPAFEKLRCVSWRYEVEERGHRNRLVFSDYRIKTTESQCDILPVACQTKDNITAAVNMVAYYKIINVEKAIYEIDDLYAGMINELETRLVKIVKQMDYSALNASDLEERMKSDKNTEVWKKWGIELIKCRLQGIQLPESLTNATISSVEEKRRCEIELLTLKAQHDKEMMRLKNEEAIEEQKRQMALLQTKHQLSVNKMENDARLQQLRERAEMIKKSGLSEQYFIQENYADAWSRLFASGNTPERLFIPTNFSNFLGSRELLAHVSPEK